MATNRDVNGSGDCIRSKCEEELSLTQLRYEEELEKIRTEGDLALIKVHTERQNVLKADEELRSLKKLLKEKKKQLNSKMTGHNTSIVAENPSGGFLLSGVPTYGSATNNCANGNSTNSTQRLAQVEERLKIIASERAAELQKLRHAIDDMRRQRLESLTSEKAASEKGQRCEDEVRECQKEFDRLKERAVTLKHEIAQQQKDFDTEKQAYRMDKQRLSLELERISKPEKSGVKAAVTSPRASSGSVYRNIRQRKERIQSKPIQQAESEPKTISFEEKKILVDSIVDQTGIRNVNDFIRLYNDRERMKAEVLARIEQQACLNSSLKDSIMQLTEDITKLSGAGDIQSIVHMEQPSELMRRIDADEAQISHFNQESQIFAETLKSLYVTNVHCGDRLKSLRNPIRELYAEFFAQEPDDDAFDSTTHEVVMLRRIGAIEERITQRIFMKILSEMETSQSSDTLRRLRHYQGLQHKPQSPHGGRLTVIPPSTNNQSCSIDDDDEPDIIGEPTSVIRSDACREQLYGKTNTNNAPPTTPTNSRLSPRKNAAIAI